MAHFAKIKDNTVLEVIVINNEILTDSNGNESEQLGIDFCKSIYGSDTEWIQTSYNGKFRGTYACIGMKYDPEADTFEVASTKDVATGTE
jgi:hypothetical protein